MNNLDSLYEIATFAVAIAILIFSSITFYYGVAYLAITKFARRFDPIVLMQTLISLGWIGIFGYIVEESIRVVPPTVISSFGSIFIRPVILLSSVAVAIWMRIRYKFEKSGRNDAWNLQRK